MTIHERYPFVWRESRKKKVEPDNKPNVMNEPIEILDLKVRSQNALKRRSINTIGDLIKVKDDLCHIRNVGETSAKEITSKLKAYLNGRSA